MYGMCLAFFFFFFSFHLFSDGVNTWKHDGWMDGWSGYFSIYRPVQIIMCSIIYIYVYLFSGRFFFLFSRRTKSNSVTNNYFFCIMHEKHCTKILIDSPNRLTLAVIVTFSFSPMSPETFMI
ncbi:hypothetical protein QBC42DRAFT_34797 [Cladorrhinum samala]|uniref:Uncharacterized protein n=1 Tax=Cladorrhinum samala TaxID=585594 RepID=A0AAV9HAL2_9PEZI|nr:hypothetical protein QBC42DRAFT_34797 [Cladorrhinum samala]